MENREKIMECAENLFYSKGYDATGVQEIAEAAGVSKPTLYYYFGSKRGLLEVLLETKFTDIRCRLQRVGGSGMGIQETLYELAFEYYRFFLEKRKFYIMLMAMFYSAQNNEVYQTVRPYLLDLYNSVTEIFENASGELGNMNGRQRQFAISFIGMLQQYLMLSREEEFSEADEDNIRALVKQYMYGIFS